MQFLVKMRDGASFSVEAAYIEVVGSPTSNYTFLGPVPGYPMAILATFPVELVAAVVPLEQAGPMPGRAADGRPSYRAPGRPLPPIAAADV
jgi:hypothetical protein